MRRFIDRGLVRGGHAANERRVEYVEYVGDPAAERRTAALVEVSTRAMRGLSGSVYVGDKGSATWSFRGVGPRLQDFTGAANATGNPVLYRNHQAGLETAGDTTITDPARRILAARRDRRRR